MPVRLGLADQAKYRNAFRIGGAVVAIIGLVLTIVGIAAFISNFSRASDPSTAFDANAGFNKNFFWAFLGLPMLGAGTTMLKIGFLGAGARYVAGETMPVVRDSASYLTKGRGIAGIGRDGADKTGPFCSKCGVRNDAGAHFCDACGTPLAGG